MKELEQAKNNLMHILAEGRIILGGLPLTGAELGRLQQNLLLLYDRAEESGEDKKEGKL